MFERDMEELIASFPDDFFPGHELRLIGRQQSFAGIGRFDLLFTDRYQSNVLMELKAVTAKFQNADQLGRYKEALESRGERSVLMWLVAPAIPTSVRELLDRIGIEYTEIHEAQFQRVALQRGIMINKPTPIPSPPEPNRTSAAMDEHYAACNNDPAMLPSIDKDTLAKLIHEFASLVKRKIDKSLAVNLRADVLEANPPCVRRQTMLQLARWCKTDGIYSDGMMVAQKISLLLYGSVLDRRKLRT